jgi:hypothetical protein
LKSWAQIFVEILDLCTIIIQLRGNAAGALMLVVARSEGDGPLPDEKDKTVDQDKWAAEQALRDREVTVKEREQRVREQDLALRKSEIAKAAWRSPLTVAIIAAAVAGFSNVVVVTINGILGRQLEDTRAESARILEMIKTGDADKAAENLRFLADAGLISDHQRLDAIRGFLKTRSPGQGPSLPSPSASGSSGPISSGPISSGPISSGPQSR